MRTFGTLTTAADPTCIRPHPRRTTGALEQIGIAPADPDETRRQLRSFTQRMRAEEDSVLGFPGNLAFDYSSTDFADLLGIFANNVGDPGSPDTSNVGAKAFERAAIDFMVDLTRGHRDSTYGYVTTGGSEGNLWGLATARNALPNATVYVSTAAHPSVFKAAELLRLRTEVLPARADDTMDPQALVDLAAGKPGGAIVVATVGTTMTGAADNITELRSAASMAGPVHLHVDAALSGFIAPFTDHGPAWDFESGADTISISAHKFLGMPVPCGIALGRESLVRDWAVGQYTGARDRTLGCSRSGLAATLIWARLRNLGYDGLRRMARESLAVAAYANSRLGTVVSTARHPHSIVVSFEMPQPLERYLPLCARSHLPLERRSKDSVLSHIVAVPHVTRGAIDLLTADFAAVMARVGAR